MKIFFIKLQNCLKRHPKALIFLESNFFPSKPVSRKFPQSKISIKTHLCWHLYCLWLLVSVKFRQPLEFSNIAQNLKSRERKLKNQNPAQKCKQKQIKIGKISNKSTKQSTHPAFQSPILREQKLCRPHNPLTI